MRITFITVVSLLATTVVAAPPTSPPGDPNVSVDQEQSQTQSQDLAQDQDQLQEQAASAQATSNADSSGSTSASDSTTIVGSWDRYLSLGLPSASPDFGSTAPCLESRRGITLGPVGWSGRTVSNEACVEATRLEREYYQCLGIADRLYSWGQQGEAIVHLRTCGAPEISDVPD